MNKLVHFCHHQMWSEDPDPDPLTLTLTLVGQL